MAVNISAKIAESSIGAAALLHVASVIQYRLGCELDQLLRAEDVVRRPLALEHGELAVPDGSGLGVEIDDAALKRFRIK